MAWYTNSQIKPSILSKECFLDVALVDIIILTSPLIESVVHATGFTNSIPLENGNLP